MENRESRIKDRESRIENRESGIKDRESRMENRESGIEDRESGLVKLGLILCFKFIGTS